MPVLKDALTNTALTHERHQSPAHITTVLSPPHPACCTQIGQLQLELQLLNQTSESMVGAWGWQVLFKSTSATVGGEGTSGWEQLVCLLKR